MSTGRRELARTLGLAVPIVLGLVGQMAMMLIDTAMVGRIGVLPVAAASFAINVIHVPLLFGFGLCVAVHVLVASAHGSGDVREQRSVLGHGLVLTGLYGLVAGLGITLGSGLLYKLGQPVEVVTEARPFAVLIGWSVLPALLQTCFKNYLEALNRPWLPLYVTAGAILLNVVVNWVLIYGNCGAPALGLSGAGVGTLVARTAALAVVALVVWRGWRGTPSAGQPAPRPGSWGQPGTVSFERLRRMVGLGAAAGIQIVAENGLFTVATLMMGRLSAAALAAHQIVYSVAGLAFMVPLGVSMALAIRIGQASGRGDAVAMRRIGFGGIAFGAGFMACYALVLVLFRHQVPLFFVQDAPEVTDLAASLLILAAAFAIFDGLQVTSNGALRGLYDVRTPTLAVIACYWAIGLPAAWLLGFHTPLGAFGIWTGLLVSLVCAAGFLVPRFGSMSARRRRHPAPPAHRVPPAH